MSEKITAMIEEIKGLSVLELAELVHALEDTFGVSAAAVAAPAAGAAAGPVVEEKTEFDVVMTEFGAEKIKVIKEVRAITGLGLADAKALRKMRKPSRPSSKLLARRSSSSKHALSSLFRNGTAVWFRAVSAKALPLVPDHFSVDKLFAFDYNILVFAESEVLFHAA